MPFYNLAKLPADQQAAIRAASAKRRAAGRTINRERTVTAFPYYSAVRFSFLPTVPIVAGAAVTYVTGAGERRAFAYAIGDTTSQAGYADGSLATSLQTNLVNRGQTLAGELVKVHGISAYLSADSDPFLASIVLERASVAISLNGDQQTYRLGRAGFLPGGGGLTGFSSSLMIPPGVNASPSTFGGVSNGVAAAGNFYKLPQPIWWQSAGNVDSTLVIVVKPEADMTTIVQTRAAATGVEEYKSPANPFVDLVFRLHSTAKSARSVNA